VVETKCGDGWYNATNQRCGTSNVIETQCGTGSSWYDTTDTNLRCQNNVIEAICGVGWYVVSVNKRCESDVVEAKCGDSDWYNSATEYCSNGTKETYGSVTDDAGKTYKTVVIGTQTWMAENLNYETESGSVCNGNVDSRCDQYGRLYDWSTAMAGASSSTANPSGVRGICPEGWHLPSQAEWNILSSFVGGSNTEGKHLKSQEGWSSCGPSGSGRSYSCEDTYGFAALPGGNGYSGGSFDYVGSYGSWWSASEYDSDFAYYRIMYYNSESADWHGSVKYLLFSVRCAQD
jgi:uncharacterized protein (TIGR02145 family)